MSMVPEGSERSEIEVVGVITVRWNGTLRYPWNSILVDSSILQKTMPMNGGSDVQVVLDIDDYGISFVGF